MEFVARYDKPPAEALQQVTTVFDQQNEELEGRGEADVVMSSVDGFYHETGRHADPELCRMLLDIASWIRHRHTAGGDPGRTPVASIAGLDLG
jgi:hypothetical protein